MNLCVHGIVVWLRVVVMIELLHGCMVYNTILLSGGYDIGGVWLLNYRLWLKWCVPSFDLESRVVGYG